MSLECGHRLIVLGLGMIGGSLAKAAKQAGLFEQVIGWDRDHKALPLALQHGVVDRVVEQIDPQLGSLGEGDLVVVAVPSLAVGQVFEQIAPLLADGAVVTDVASVKGSVVRQAHDILADRAMQFVPGHPIAGSERSGVAAADAGLFQGRKIILTPLADNSEAAIQRVTALWQGIGAWIAHMPVDEHDHILALTSHLPHVLAFSIVDTLATNSQNRDVFRYAAGGLRDFTRIAASDPRMWHDIVLANQDMVLSSLDDFLENLITLRQAIESNDSAQIKGVFTRAKGARDYFSKLLDKKAYWEPLQMQGSVEFCVQAGGQINGEIRVPGDKSISHRSIMLGALADGVTRIEGFLEGEDSLATLQAFRDMGVVIEGPDHGVVTVHGVGIDGLKAAPGPLYLGNSGTSMRLLAGLMSAQPFDVEMAGDESLSKRPMGRVADPLALMGAKIETAEAGRPPLKVSGAQALTGIHYELPMASAQVKSCLLLAGLYAEGTTTVVEPAPTRDHTERMLRGFGYEVTTDGSSMSLTGGGRLTATDIEVPADISSATFFMVGAAIGADSDVLLTHVGINPTRIGVINILKQMGADLTLSNEREVGGEPVADIRIRRSDLKGIEIPQDQVPLAIDEFPALFVAAACAEGRTVLRGAEELRVKESDRIQVMADGLLALGIDVEVLDDGIVIQGGQFTSGVVESHGDHRIAMSFAMAALRATGPIRILDCANVATSFPNFVTLAQAAGLNVNVEEH